MGVDDVISQLNQFTTLSIDTIVMVTWFDLHHRLHQNSIIQQLVVYENPVIQNRYVNLRTCNLSSSGLKRTSLKAKVILIASSVSAAVYNSFLEIRLSFKKCEEKELGAYVSIKRGVVFILNVIHRAELDQDDLSCWTTAQSQGTK